MKKECKLMEMARIKSFESEKDLISKYISDMDYFQPGEIVPFKALLANNIRDRQLDRFPKKSLKIFENTIIGKLRLLNHNSSERTGRFYDAKIIKKSKEEVLKLFENTNVPGLDKHLDEVEAIDKGLYFLETKFYMLNKTPTQQEYVSNVVGGIDSFMSISFAGFKSIPVYEKQGDNQITKYWELQAIDGYPAEALEGSAVFLGAQYTAQITKEYLPTNTKVNWIEPDEIESDNERDVCVKLDELIKKGLTVDISGPIPEFLESTENWDSKFIKALPDEYFLENRKHPIYEKENKIYLPNIRKLMSEIGNNKIESDGIKAKVQNILKKIGLEYNFNKKKEKTMTEIILAIPSLNIAKMVDTEKGKEWQAEIDSAVQNRLEESEKALAIAAKLEKVFGKDYKMEAIEQAKKDAEAYRNSLVKDALVYGKTAKMVPENEEISKKAFFEKLEIEQLKEFIETYKSACKSTPGPRQVNDNPIVDSSGKKEATPDDFNKAYVSGYQAQI